MQSEGLVSAVSMDINNCNDNNKLSRWLRVLNYDKLLVVPRYEFSLLTLNVLQPEGLVSAVSMDSYICDNSK